MLFLSRNVHTVLPPAPVRSFSSFPSYYPPLPSPPLPSVHHRLRATYIRFSQTSHMHFSHYSFSLCSPPASNRTMPSRWPGRPQTSVAHSVAHSVHSAHMILYCIVFYCFLGAVSCSFTLVYITVHMYTWLKPPYTIVTYTQSFTPLKLFTQLSRHSLQNCTPPFHFILTVYLPLVLLSIISKPQMFFFLKKKLPPYPCTSETCPKIHVIIHILI